MTSRALAAPLAALVLVLSACSGGDDAAAPAEVDPEESYVEQATEICSSADEEFVALGGTPTTPEDYGPYVQESVGIADRALQGNAAGDAAGDAMRLARAYAGHGLAAAAEAG